MTVYHCLRVNRESRIVPACLYALVLAVLFCITGSSTMADEQRRRIYFLESLAPTQTAAMQTIEAFRRRLREKTSESFEIFIDYMELERFPGQEHIDRTVRYLRGKYTEAAPDVLIPLGRAAVPFMQQYRKVIAPDAPLILTSVPRREANEAPNIDNAVWVVTDYDFAKTLKFARQLQPKARQVVVIGGTSEYDRLWLEDARRDLEPSRGVYDIKYLSDIGYEQLLKHVSGLPRDTIVLLGFVFKDGDGQLRNPPDVAATVAKVSSAPVYSPVPSFFGRGIVGGFMDSFEEQGVAAADLALEILSGKSTAKLERITRAAHQYRADARQLDKWGLPATRLLSDTIVSFQKPNIWEEHRKLVLAAILTFILQTGLVLGLFIHRRQRRVAEQQLKETEDRLLSAAASANVGLWQLEQESNQFWMTEHCRTLFCLPSDAPLTRASLMTTVHPEDRTMAAAALQAADPDRHSTGDIRILTPNDQTRWIRIRTRFHSRERPVSKRLRGIFIDITDQKTAELEVARIRAVREQEGRLITMNAMSASIAHELSQPIGAMMASAEAALIWLDKVPPEPGKARSSVSRIADEGRRASKVIASVRSLFRHESGTESIEVSEIMREILTLEHDELRRKGIVVITEFASSATVEFDRIQLQQVILNLITNAIDAMSAGPYQQRVLHLKAESLATGDIVIAVEDSGLGIDSERLDRIFEPFFTTKSGGMGLGLWLCRKIVENHRGQLTVSSELGSGSRFEIVLPCVDPIRAPAEEARVSYV